MPIRSIVSVVVAITLGILAVVLVRNYLERAQRPTVSTSSNIPATGSVPVIVANEPIARGATLEPTMLKVANFPKGNVPVNSFQNIDELTGQNGKRLALRSFVPDEPILNGEVSEPNGKLNLSTVLRAGMRAISVRSNEVAGVGGFILPGDHVDVILTHQTAAGEHQRSFTQVLAENALVLGVDQSANEESNTPVVAKAITVEVTPEQAQSISLGESLGVVTLALRYVSDNTSLPQRVITDADLNRTGTEPVTGHRQGGGGGIRVTRGVTVTSYSFGQTTPTSQQAGGTTAAAGEGRTKP